jgi:hypothetical protein
MDIHIARVETRSKSYPWEQEKWINEAVSSPHRHVHAVLDELGVDDHSRLTADLTEDVGRVVQAFPEDFAPLGEHLPPSAKGKSSMADTIRRWWSRIKVVEEDHTVITREVPLCVFNCPAVRKAKTSFAESETTEGTAGWSIDVVGSGYGSDVTLLVSQANTFNASAGERKLVFAPLQFRLTRIAVYKGKAFQGRSLRSEVFEPGNGRDANALREVAEAEWGEFVGEGPVIERFDLSRNRGKDLTTYERGRDLTGTFEAKVGFDAFNLKTVIQAKCTAKQSIAMKFELPAGRSYELRAPTTISGFYFR